MGGRFDALRVDPGQRLEVVQDARELRRETVDVLGRQVDAGQPRDVEDILRGQGHGTKGKASARTGIANWRRLPARPAAKHTWRVPPLTTHVTYDEVPYDGGLMDRIHPNTFAVLGTLFGMSPPSVETCSVLEIGCASGGNLVPMAYGLPAASFVGIDPAGAQLRIAAQRAADLAVKNVRLVEADIRDFASSGERFDYIVCHGVFSWVDDEVRQAILDACRQLLNPQGIAYISYNTYPGFHGRAPIRDAMRFHASYFPETEDRIGQAQAFMQFLGQATAAITDASGSPGTYHALVEKEATLLEHANASYIAHEHLSDENRAFYFHEFSAMLEPAGLKYLGDAQFETMVTWNLPPEVAAAVEALSNSQMFTEQYRDFLVNRGFRRSLLCRSDVELKRTVEVDPISRMRVRLSQVRDAGGPWTVSRAGGAQVTVSDEGLCAILDHLEAHAPACPPFGDIVGGVGQLGGDETRIAGLLMTLFGHGAIDFRLQVPDVATDVPERPRSYLPARLGLQTGSAWAVSPFHISLAFDPISAAVLEDADGSRDRAGLRMRLLERIRAGHFGETTEPTPEDLARVVDESLEQLRFHGMLAP